MRLYYRSHPGNTFGVVSGEFHGSPLHVVEDRIATLGAYPPRVGSEYLTVDEFGATLFRVETKPVTVGAVRA